MSAELGDAPLGGAIVTTEESGGTNLSAGDAVTLDANDQIAPAGAGDDLYGVVSGPAHGGVDLANLAAGDTLSIVIWGPVNANVAGTVAKGNVLETSATAGQLAANANGTEHAVDEGGTAAYTLALDTGVALSGAGGTSPAGESLGANAASVFLK